MDGVSGGPHCHESERPRPLQNVSNRAGGTMIDHDM